MKAASGIIFLLSCAVVTAVMDSLSDEFIEYLNSQQSTWKAGRNFDANTPAHYFKKLFGAVQSDPFLRGIAPTVHSKDIDIPDTFDARTNWPDCTDIISNIADQSSCGASWAISTTSAMTDRRCIASNGTLKVPVSAEDVLSCCGVECGDGCDGADDYEAWDYWNYIGIVTGGKYNSAEGCRPYSMQPCDHYINGSYVSCDSLSYGTPFCNKSCISEDLQYVADKTFGEGSPMWLDTVEDIQREILQNGPVTAGFMVHEDFLSYKSGVYQYTSGMAVSFHSARVLGWGNDDDLPYWLLANSWNENWGDQGLFKIFRGNDTVFIESQVYASLPKL